MKKPIISIVCGTRPEIVKLAPVYHALRDASWAEVVWIHTGQHESMAEEMFQCFDIAPAIRLRRTGKTLEEFSIGCRSQLDAALGERPFDLCLVQGDTESAFLGMV